MRAIRITLGAVIGALILGQAQADEGFVPETLTVEQHIKPGDNLFVLDQNWKGPSRVNVLSGDDLSNKGIVSMGVVGQMVLSQDRKPVWTTSIYAKRIMYGPQEAVLQEFDVDTLSLKREIPIAVKMAQTAPYSSMLRLNADENYMLVQNATPASSVTVVDLTAGRQIAEIPTPGCWGVYPAPTGLKFSMLCGDGTAATVEFRPTGIFFPAQRSAKFFDVDSDPLFMHAERAGKDLLFTSFNGNLYRLSDEGASLKLRDKVSVTAGVPGDWAPGGFQVSAWNPANGVLFLAMHPDAKEGSHKEAATEVWAWDLKRQKLMYRSVVEEPVSITVTPGKHPVLFGIGEEGLVTRYEVDPEARFAARLTRKVEDVGEFTLLGTTSSAGE